MERLLRAVGACAVAFLVVLGAVAALPDGVREAVPDRVVGGAVLVLGVVALRARARTRSRDRSRTRTRAEARVRV
ncbi:hypothetical protein, partial [Streptomyces sp. WAC06614]|uniref:hypothetical protein n=1 Tax=Streptomyces sp. WAC06614 TaxID=2487416 RepID=UPI001C8D6DD6